MLGAGDSVLVDVRERDEYARVHIDGSLWLPVGEIVSRHAEIPSDKNVLLICRSGVRSGLAAEYLSALGVAPARLFNVEAGVEHWLAVSGSSAN